jgi:RNA polymerase sigma factor (sigma-70 family)
MGREQVDSLLAIERTPRGLDERLGGEDGTAGTLGELLADPAAEDEYERVMERMEIEQVRHLSDGLGDREREIIFDHYGLGRPSMTLREIGDRLGVSAERVRQIEEQALAKLRAAVTAPPAVP